MISKDALSDENGLERCKSENNAAGEPTGEDGRDDLGCSRVLVVACVEIADSGLTNALSGRNSVRCQTTIFLACNRLFRPRKYIVADDSPHRLALHSQEPGG